MRFSTFVSALFILLFAGIASAQEEGSRGVGVTLSGSTGGFALQKVETQTSQALALLLKNGNYDFGLVADQRETGYVVYATLFKQRDEYGSRAGLRGSLYLPIMKRTRLVDVGPEAIGGWSHYVVWNDLEYGGALRVRVHTATGALSFAAGATKGLPLFGQVRFEWYH